MQFFAAFSFGIKLTTTSEFCISQRVFHHLCWCFFCIFNVFFLPLKFYTCPSPFLPPSPDPPVGTLLPHSGVQHSGSALHSRAGESRLPGPALPTTATSSGWTYRAREGRPPCHRAGPSNERVQQVYTQQGCVSLLSLDGKLESRVCG